MIPKYLPKYLKVLYLFPGAGNPVSQYEKRLVDQINITTPDVHIDLWDWTTEFGFASNPTLSWAEQNKTLLSPFYSKLKNKSVEYDIVLIGQTGGVLPEIMSELPATVVYITADDPDSSEICSIPFLKSADVIAHVGVCFDAHRTIENVFLSKGAKRCIHFPLGFYEDMFPAIDDFEGQFKRRNIDLIYLGHLKRGKLEVMIRRFRKMVVHSRTLHLKHKLYLLANTGRWIRPFTGDVGNLYCHSKVGINMHFTFGPSNARCYQLNACGVAQVMDCREGVGALYVPEEEVLTYSTMDEAIEAVQRLLSDDILRYRISYNGYLKARECFNRRNTFVTLLHSI